MFLKKDNSINLAHRFEMGEILIYKGIEFLESKGAPFVDFSIMCMDKNALMKEIENSPGRFKNLFKDLALNGATKVACFIGIEGPTGEHMYVFPLFFGKDFLDCCEKSGADHYKIGLLLKYLYIALEEWYEKYKNSIIETAANMK